MPVSHAAHKVYKIKYHIVICVKYRKKLLLTVDRISFLKSTLSEIEQRYDMRFDAIGTDGDYVHLFVDAPPKYAPFSFWHTTGISPLGLDKLSPRKVFNRTLYKTHYNVPIPNFV